MLGTIILVILILALVGAIPQWGYNSGWGYSPVGIILVILVLYLIFGGGVHHYW